MSEFTPLISEIEVKPRIEKTGQMAFTKQPDSGLEGSDFLTVEDIVDMGIKRLKKTKFINSLNPRSIKMCTLIDKHERRGVEINVNDSCFSLDKGFIVGYGLDYNGNYRNLPAIYDLKL